MPTRHGTAFWPGAVGCVSCTYTCSHGVTPGIATLEIPEQDARRLSSFGALVITDGVGAVRLPRCRVVSIDWGRGTGGGRTILLHIADRRWQWRFGAITGNFNVTDPFPDPDLFPEDGEFAAPEGQPFTPGTFRPANRLMEDCLRAMGETNFLIQNPPTEPVPVSWDAEPPAYALADVAERLGYRVVYQPFGDRVLVVPVGTGLTLPENIEIVSQNVAVQTPQRPATIRLFGGPTVFNDMLPLEPVGLEPGGGGLNAVKPIEELSYRPAEGWTLANPATFAKARATNQLTHQEAVNLAKRCVWRMFRVKMVDVVTDVAPGPNVPTFGVVRDRKEIVLTDHRVGITKLVNGQLDSEPAFLSGSIYQAAGEFRLDGGRVAVDGNTDPEAGVRLPRNVSVDSERGLVITDNQCFRHNLVNGKAQWTPPVLWLHTGFMLRSIVGQRYNRFEAGGTLPDLIDMGCPPEILRHPELVKIVRVVRKDATREVSEVTDNLRDIGPRADSLLASANAKWKVTAADDKTYAGVVPVNLDGARFQVTWSVGGGSPATTRASLNTEHAHLLPTFNERRRIERLVAAFEGKLGRLNDPPPPGNPFVPFVPFVVQNGFRGGFGGGAP